MAYKRNSGQERSTPKIVILMSLVFIIISITSAVMTSYPQHLYIDNKTVIAAQVAFGDNNTVNIRGNQVQINPGDTIAIDGRDYVRITGRQVQLGSGTYAEGIRALGTTLAQNIFFEQKIGEMSINNVAQIGIDGDISSIIPMSQSVLNIRTTDSTYNIELVSDTAYITTGKGVMLKLKKDKDNDMIRISIVGIKSYQSIWIKTL